MISVISVAKQEFLTQEFKSPERASKKKHEKTFAKLLI
jgi:hypothetical protein